MSHPSHRGEPMPDHSHSHNRCGYGWGHGHTGCTEPATAHFRIVEPAFTFVTAACAGHTDETRTALPVRGEHPFRRSCARSPVTWYDSPTGSWCGP